MQSNWTACGGIVYDLSESELDAKGVVAVESESDSGCAVVMIKTEQRCASDQGKSVIDVSQESGAQYRHESVSAIPLGRLVSIAHAQFREKVKHCHVGECGSDVGKKLTADTS